MEYQRFAALRQEACRLFEQSLDTARRAPKRLGYDELERLAVLYRQLLHDHALARSRFPGTAIARRLERLVIQGTHFLQRDRGDHLPSLREFLSHRFPDAMARQSGHLVVSASLFVVAALFGFCLAAVDAGLATAFLPAESIDGLARGELWTDSIFAVTPGSVASTKIATNNLGVLLMAWAGGMAAGIGAFWILLLNGLMLGAVLATVARYSMADSLLEFIAAHGPLELSLIVVAAAAGLRVGEAVVRAGELPRGEAIRRAGRDSFVVLLGCLPWIVLLGLVEGFVSPHTGLGVSTKAALGVTLEGLFVLMAWNPLRRFDPRDLTSVGRPDASPRPEPSDG